MAHEASLSPHNFFFPVWKGEQDTCSLARALSCFLETALGVAAEQYNYLGSRGSRGSRTPRARRSPHSYRLQGSHRNAVRLLHIYETLEKVTAV